jgi:chromosome segregation ATPase
VLEPGAFIPVRASVMADLEATLADNVPLTLQRVTKLIERLDMVFSKVKPEDLPGIFRRVEDLLETANKAVGEVGSRAAGVAASLDKAVQSARAEAEKVLGRAASAAAAIGQSAETTAARAQKLLEAAQAAIEENRKPLADTLRRLDAALAELQKQLEGADLAATTKAIRGAADKLGKGADAVASGATTIAGAAKDLAAGRDDVRRSLANIERDLVRTLDDLDRVLRSARDFFDTIERDPSAILRGRRGEP